jgi:hypothetical protein
MEEGLSGYGLARCNRCRRILLDQHVMGGVCKPGRDCGAHELIKWAHEDGDLEFARSIEQGLNHYEETK